MKVYICIIAALLCLLLPACGVPETPAVETVPTVETAPPETALPTLPPETTVATLPPETTPPPTEPEHSPFYIPGITVEEVILYFNEVCLDAEMVNSGDPSLLQKWTVPIQYMVYGDFSSEDLTVFNDFLQWLNTLEGFPGISEAQRPELANLRIFFCGQEQMLSRMGEGFSGLDGAVTFWYEYNEIYDAVICYRDDISQYTRNSVILEELYNGLGPIQDTDLRPDSIIYSGFSEPQQLTAMDELLLRLLYNPRLVCGMDASACEAVIRQLYY